MYLLTYLAVNWSSSDVNENLLLAAHHICSRQSCMSPSSKHNCCPRSRSSLLNKALTSITLCQRQSHNGVVVQQNNKSSANAEKQCVSYACHCNLLTAACTMCIWRPISRLTPTKCINLISAKTRVLEPDFEKKS